MIATMSRSASIVIIGAPGAGKTTAVEALSDLLAESGTPHGAIELEQLAWGHPWLPFAAAAAQLRTVLIEQRRLGRTLFLITATPETDDELESLVAANGRGRVWVIALRAPADTVAARVMEREPEHWSGRAALAEHARALASDVPSLARVDVVVDTEGRSPRDTARTIADEVLRLERASG